VAFPAALVAGPRGIRVTGPGFRATLCLALLVALPVVVAARGTGDARLVSIPALAADPDRYVGQSVQIRGRLVNVGTNYFTDLRLALSDSAGARFVYLSPFLPLAIAPAPRGGAAPAPPTVSQYLGERLIVRGVVVEGRLKNVGATYLIDVESARRPSGELFFADG
jgi:hypothetical protein